MTTSRVIMWGINRPDGSPVHAPPEWGRTFWTHKDGEHGYPDEHEDAAPKGAEELTQALIRQGVKPEDAKHEVVRIVVTTTTERELDWLPE